MVGRVRSVGLPLMLMRRRCRRRCLWPSPSSSHARSRLRGSGVREIRCRPVPNRDRAGVQDRRRAGAPHDLRHRRASLWHLGGPPAAEARPGSGTRRRSTYAPTLTWSWIGRPIFRVFLDPMRGLETADPFITSVDSMSSSVEASREKPHESKKRAGPRWRPKTADGKHVDPT